MVRVGFGGREGALASALIIYMHLYHEIILLGKGRKFSCSINIDCLFLCFINFPLLGDLVSLLSVTLKRFYFTRANTALCKRCSAFLRIIRPDGLSSLYNSTHRSNIKSMSSANDRWRSNQTPAGARCRSEYIEAQ